MIRLAFAAFAAFAVFAAFAAFATAPKESNAAKHTRRLPSTRRGGLSVYFHFRVGMCAWDGGVGR